jgi:predicted permease
MMKRFPEIRRVFRLGLWRNELQEELAFHFERTVEELIGKGMPRKEAEAEAHRRFGEERRYRRELEQIDGRAAVARGWAERWEVVVDSVRYALRRMWRSPGLTAGVALTFALGIGANATMFGIVDRLLLSPPAHVEDADRVVRIMVDRYNRYTDTRGTSDVLTYPDYLDLTGARAFSSVAAIAGAESGKITVGRGAEARQLGSNQVTGNFFSLLGARPALGRFFGPEEDAAGAPGVAVISHGAWQRMYGGDRGVLGKMLDFGYGPYTIVGVAPRGFTGAGLRGVDVWLPLRTTAAHTSPYCLKTRNCHWLRVVARLAPGVAAQTAEAEATALYRRGWAEHDDQNLVDPQASVATASLIAARRPGVSSESQVALWLAGISLIVLLIACANVANLLLARAVRQRREIGIRLALGSSRGRVLGQMLTESLLFALLGGAAAFLLTWWGGAFLRRFLLPEVVWEATGLEGRTVAIVVLFASFAGAMAGILPAIQSSRPDVVETLKSGSRTTSTPVSRTRSALTILQAALSVVLLVGAGLFVRSLHHVNDLDLGLDPDGVLLVNPEFDREMPEERQAEFYREASRHLRSLPGVEAVSADVSTPFWSVVSISLRVPGVDSIPSLASGTPILHAVGHDYFRVLDLEVTRGRGFQPGDVEGAQRVAVVNETMARVLWPGQSAIGKCLIIGDDANEPGEPPCAEVVGVVENARRFNLVEEEAMQYYVLLEQKVADSTPNSLLVRVRGEPAEQIPAVRRALLALEPGLRFPDVRPLRELIDPQARSWRLGATMFTVFGVLALLVAGIGLYSVLAFGVAQRTMELGIRSALGASRERLMGLVLGQGLRLVGVGALLGLLIALVGAPRIESLLFQVSPHDPLTLGLVMGILLLVAVLASGVPAWRATRVDPSVALRAE